MWPNPPFPANLVTFAEEILNGKLQFLCSVSNLNDANSNSNLRCGNTAHNISNSLTTHRVILQILNYS